MCVVVGSCEGVGVGACVCAGVRAGAGEGRVSCCSACIGLVAIISMCSSICMGVRVASACLRVFVILCPLCSPEGGI